MFVSQRQLFLQHVAQTSPAPIGLEIVKAEGIFMWDVEGKKYVDLISGFSVMNIGHGNEKVKAAIKKQVDDYMHLMVYGEMIETPQVQYAKKLTEYLPQQLDCVYFTNSGAEATEGAMKLAKRVTGRSQIIAFKNAYHGSTQGALSIMGDEYWRQAYRPLLPDVLHLNFNDTQAIETISTQTACVVMEVVQAEAGVVKANRQWLQAIRQRCTDTGTLLVFDEIQTGFGRTGTLWAFEQYELVPDILMLGKALGGGLPLGAFIASHERMKTFTHQPALGHISTFAGHPVCCAAGLAGFDELLKLSTDGHQLPGVSTTEALFKESLHHSLIQSVRIAGMLMAVEFANAEICQEVCRHCIRAGLITDWFLFAPHCMRIAPPLTLTREEGQAIIATLHQVMDEVNGNYR